LIAAQQVYIKEHTQGVPLQHQDTDPAAAVTGCSCSCLIWSICSPCHSEVWHKPTPELVFL